VSDTEHDPNQAYAHEYEGDHAPGVLPEESAGHWIRNYTIGLVLAALLTTMSFVLAATHLVWGPSIPVALIVLAIFVLVALLAIGSAWLYGLYLAANR